MHTTNNQHHQQLIDYLKQTYGDHLFTRNGGAYPALVFPPAPEQYHDVDSVLCPDVPDEYTDPAVFPIYDAAHLDALRGSRPHLTNGVSYLLHRLMLNPLKVEARLGFYFDMLATCDALSLELCRFARGEQASLPLREQFHAAIPPAEAIYSGMGRSALLGVNVLTVFRHQGDCRAIIARRSSSVGIDPGKFHVLPAFVLQPSGPTSFYAAEWSVSNQLYREFGEELFGMPEFVDWDRPQTPDYFYQHPAVQDLQVMVAAGRTEMHLTGVAFNLLTLRVEICVLLLIHDADWYARSQQGLEAALLTERQETRYIPLDTLDGLPDDLHLHMVPHGAAAFWLGIDRARALLG